jgi:hypothetical protein
VRPPTFCTDRSTRTPSCFAAACRPPAGSRRGAPARRRPLSPASKGPPLPHRRLHPSSARMVGSGGSGQRQAVRIQANVIIPDSRRRSHPDGQVTDPAALDAFCGQADPVRIVLGSAGLRARRRATLRRGVGSADLPGGSSASGIFGVAGSSRSATVGRTRRLMMFRRSLRNLIEQTDHDDLSKLLT